MKPNLHEKSFEWISFDNKEITLNKDWIKNNLVK